MSLPERLRIVLVDAGSDALQSTRRVLERSYPGVAVQAFGTGRDALDWLLRPDAPQVELILLDFERRDSGGPQFLEAYERLHPSQRARAVVAMLGISPGSNERSCVPGPDGLRHRLAKPIDAAQALDLARLLS